VPRVKVVPVTSVAFDRDVAFTTVRRDEHDGCVGLPSSRSSRGSAVGGRGNDLGAILRSLRLDRVGRTDQVWILSGAGSPAVKNDVS